MGNVWKSKPKPENVYMEKIKNLDIENAEVNEITIDNKVLIQCIQEIIKEVNDLQEKDLKRVHLMTPKLDFCNFSML